MNKVLKYSTLISAVIIYVGFLRLHFYYSNFNININDYLELSEIITSFLDDLSIIFVIILVAVFNVLTFTYITHRIFNRGKNRKVSIEVTERVIGIIYSTRQMVIATSIISLIASIIFFFLMINFNYNYIWIFFFTLTSLNFATAIIELIREDKNKFYETIINSSIILLACFILSWSLGNREYNRLMAQNYKGCKVISNKVFNLKSSDKMLGKTKNFIFLKYDGKITIISQSQIKLIEIP